MLAVIKPILWILTSIQTSNRFDNLLSVENTQNDAKIDDGIEIDVAKARKIPFVKSSKSAIKKGHEVVINKSLENKSQEYKRQT